MLVTLLAFLVALAVLITVHEWGHYRVAVACGVKVLRFSIGFGRQLWRFKPRRQHPGQDTEFVIAAIPFGGYVKMLDEREGEVAPEERHRAFNTQPLRVRAAIVAAGPIANLVLAVLLYALVSMVGMEEPRAVIAPPVAGSMAEKAGLRAGDEVLGVRLAEGAEARVLSFETVRWYLTRGAIDGLDVTLRYARGGGEREVRLPLSTLPSREPDAAMFRAIGLMSPRRAPLIGEVLPGSAAERAGLRDGDVVRRAGDTVIEDGAQLREWIRASGSGGTKPRAEQWLVERAGSELLIEVQPDLVQDEASGESIGRLGAAVGAPPEMVLVRRGPLASLWHGMQRTQETSLLTLRLMGRMVLGQFSVKNLSGPITIADYAGRAARLGLVHFLNLLAYISVSLGVLNLLPLPVLDGGHLMYYLWEAVTGKAVDGVWLQRLQYAGLSLLMAMMAVAMFNDIVARL
ncbi:MAG: RIP metalloprotease RseP [Ottowia sp.]|nr:RIP metalloprotease RseP [Ottowia sp.]